MGVTIDKLDMGKGESMIVTANGSLEVSVSIRESGGRLIIEGPLNKNKKVIIIEQDVKVED